METGLKHHNVPKCTFPVDFHASDNRGFWSNRCYFNIFGSIMTYFGLSEIVSCVFETNYFFPNPFHPLCIISGPLWYIHDDWQSDLARKLPLGVNFVQFPTTQAKSWKWRK